MQGRILGRLFLVLWSFLPGALHAAAWETDFEKALAAAKEQSRFLLLDFTGSDWCGWCIKLDNEVFSKPAFKKYAEEKLVCVTLDYPRSKPQKNSEIKQNMELARRFKIDGYPTILLLSPSGEEVARTGYQPGGAESYVGHLQSLLKDHAAAPPTPAPAAATGPAVRAWTDVRGRVIRAALVSVSPTDVTLKTETGEEMNVPRQNLSFGDRQFLSSQNN